VPIAHRLVIIQLPEDGRVACIIELEALAGCARGLTSQNDAFTVDLGDEEDQKALADANARMDAARADPRMVALRETVAGALRRCVELWAEDTAISDVSPVLSSPLLSPLP
jgi:hypothetical protein